MAPDQTPLQSAAGAEALPATAASGVQPPAAVAETAVAARSEERREASAARTRTGRQPLPITTRRAAPEEEEEERTATWQVVTAAPTGAAGGGGGRANAGGNGTKGIIVITYTAAPNLTQTRYRWRNDTGSETSSVWQTAAENATGSATSTANVYRLRIEVTNTRATTTQPKLQLQYQYNATSGSWTLVPTTSTFSSQLFLIASSTNFTDGASTTAQLTADANASTSGQIKQSSSTTGLVNIGFSYSSPTSTWTEVEYAIRAGPQDVYGNNGTYYFRLQEATSASFVAFDSYNVYPALSLSLPQPRRPILNFPVAATTTVDTASTTFKMTATLTSTSNQYVQYKWVLYQNEACTDVVTSSTEPSSQTNWSGQNASSGSSNSTAYSATSATGTSGIFQYTLTAGTYWWGAQAYDPDNSGLYGSSTLTRVDNTWATNAASLPATAALYGHSAVVYNGYIYTTGGATSTTGAPATTPATSSVFYAQISSNGAVGAWSTNSNKLLSGIANHSAVAYNGYIYTIGGATTTAANVPATTSVFFAKINQDGTVGTWTLNSSSLSSPLNELSAVAYNGYLYAIGGATNTAAGAPATTSVFYAQINSSGTVGTWTLNSNSLPSPLMFHSAVAYNGYIYTTGEPRPLPASPPLPFSSPR